MLAHDRPSASVSRTRPRLWAAITMPFAQRRRPVCQTQPANVRSSPVSVGSATRAHVVATRGPAECVGGTRQRADGRVGGDAAMLDTGAGDVFDAPAGGLVALLPLLFLAAPVDRLVELADPLERAAADRHVGAPHELDLAVRRAAVERRDRRRLASTRTRSAALQPCRDRTAEHVAVGALGCRAQEGLQPSRLRLDVVVDEHHEVAGGARDPGVAGGVGAACADRARSARRPGSRPRARSRASSPSDTTITSAPCSRACGITDASVTVRYSGRPRVGITIELERVADTLGLCRRAERYRWRRAWRCLFSCSANAPTKRGL